MGNDEEGKSPKSEKPNSPPPPPPDQPNVHVYPDWAAMQAFYGPRLTLPPYYNSAMASGHAPHPYIWAPPQPMMPHYGAPYAAIYSPGGVYPHPAVPIGSQSHGHGVQSSPLVSGALAAPPLSIETPAKPSGNTDRGLMKKLKGFDGLAMSIGNGNGESTDGGSDHGLSQSGETEGSSDGSDGNTTGADQTRRKRSREGTPPIGRDGKTETPTTPAPSAEVNAGSDKVLGVAVAPASVTGKLAGTVISPRMSPELELRNPPSVNAKTSPTTIPQPGAMVPPESWMLNERELKRERRKQSNRESARRSRLRKQAETEELATKVESLITENSLLKSEVSRLADKSEKLKLENATLMEKLKNAQIEQAEVHLIKVDDDRTTPVNTENLLSRVNNAGSVDRSNEEEEDIMYEKNTNTGAKLHQLLDTSPRADAVAAG